MENQQKQKEEKDRIINSNNAFNFDNVKFEDAKRTKR